MTDPTDATNPASGGTHPDTAVGETRLLGPEDLADVLALYEIGLASVPDHMLAREHPDHFPAHLGPKGLTLGRYVGNRLIAYSILGLPRSGDASFAEDLPDALRSVCPRERIAHLDGTVVHPEFRGAGLQALLTEDRITRALALGRSGLLTYVAPDNLPSLRTMLGAGLVVVRCLRKFGGLERFLLASHSWLSADHTRRLDENIPLTWIELSDRSNQNARLERGHIAIRLDFGQPNPRLGFIGAP